MNDNEYIEFMGEKIKIPDIALGKKIPHKIEQLIEAEEKAKKAEQKAKLYLWVGIGTSILCMIGGYLLGKFC